MTEETLGLTIHQCYLTRKILAHIMTALEGNATKAAKKYVESFLTETERGELELLFETVATLRYRLRLSDTNTGNEENHA